MAVLASCGSCAPEASRWAPNACDAVRNARACTWSTSSPYRVTTDSAHSLPVAPNLSDRRFDGWQPNQALVSDSTFIATDDGWPFLAEILDLSSRRILGWSMSERMQDGLV